MSSEPEANGSAVGGASFEVPQDMRLAPMQDQRRRWGWCWMGITCFSSQKRAKKRVVPASRIPDGSPSVNRTNGPQAIALPNQATTLAPSLLAPPSSPASFVNSALHSTIQSPSSYLSMSASSPMGPSNMFATGPYAHETQLVSPPVFSTFTTEPSTAPFTPPPELSHPTTPSSPEVPYAQFLYSSLDIKSTRKEDGLSSMSSFLINNGCQSTYPPFCGSPTRRLLSPGATGGRFSGNSHDHKLPGCKTDSMSDHPLQSHSNSKLFALDSGLSRTFVLSEDSSFLPSAQFYLDQAHSGGRISFSHEADMHTNNGNMYHRHSNAEEIEAYRASFGFSADEIVSTTQYVEMSDSVDDSFTITPFASNHSYIKESVPELHTITQHNTVQSCSKNAKNRMVEISSSKDAHDAFVETKVDCCKCAVSADKTCRKESSKASLDIVAASEDDLMSRVADVKIADRSSSLSISDAEIDYGRGNRKGRIHGFR